MDKQQFMAELKQLLGELPATEREEALSYYEDYFADAGEENEASVIQELESPEKVAFTIKAGLADEDKIEGEFTDTGFKGYEDTSKDEIINTIPESDQRGFTKKNNQNTLLIIILLIILIPVIVPLLGTLLGLIGGLLGTILGVMCALAGAGIACIVAGVTLLIASFSCISTATYASLVFIGGALVLIGLGAALVEVGVKIIGKFFPMFFRGIISICKKLIDAINRKRGIV